MRNEGSFVDLRQWIDLLEREGELHRITAPVSWDREIGTVSRKVLERKGPALLFENIRGYEGARGRRVFTGGIGTRERLAIALGFPKHTSNRDIVQHVMKKNRERIPPVRVATGPVKENIVKGDAIDLLEFPVPKWHYLEGGQHLCLHRDQRPRDGCAERRHLSWHGRAEELHPVATHYGRSALGPAFRQVCRS